MKDILQVLIVIGFFGFMFAHILIKYGIFEF